MYKHYIRSKFCIYKGRTGNYFDFPETLFYSTWIGESLLLSSFTGALHYVMCMHPCFAYYFLYSLFPLFSRALLHFLDPDKFKNKDDFVQNYKNLSSFNESEVGLNGFFILLP